MSLIINDANMPKNCKDCPCREYGKFSYEPDWCCLNRKNIVNAKTISPNCPLSEIPTPHGRLIDADELMKVIEANDYTLQSYYNTTDRGMFTIGIKQAIDEAPTIIEAEG